METQKPNQNNKDDNKDNNNEKSNQESTNSKHVVEAFQKMFLYIYTAHHHIKKYLYT